MKKIVLYVFSIIFLASFVCLALWFRTKDQKTNLSSVSPVPDFLNLSKNNQVRILDLWTPTKVRATTQGFDIKNLSAKSAIIYDLTQNKILFEKNTNVKLPMASLTKIMTAIIALENPKDDDSYYVSKSALVGEDSMGLSAGEVLSLNELLYGLMLPSGNDAAEVIAENFPTGRRGFIEAMNEKAISLGLVNTKFDNPSGLQGDGTQFTTASDLLVITKYALDNYPKFSKVVSTPEIIINQTSTHKAFDLYNETNLLTTYPGVQGVKTGYTPEAGLCLVTYVDYKGHKIIGVILNSENRRGEMKDLLDYSLKSVGINPPKYKG